MSAQAQPLRVGLLGASNIARQVWAAIHDTGSRVTFIGCRDTAKGQTFADELCAKFGVAAEQAPRLGSYADCVSSEEVDIVYISIPVTHRDYWVMQCVEHNKHVVGEKPPAVDADMLRAWIEALDAKHLLYMDGTMFSHGARVKKVCESLKNDVGGPIKHIFTNFSFCGPEEFLRSDIRMDPSLEPHGALGDLGWYNIRYILHLMDFAMPAEVTGRIIRQNEKGAIVEFSGDLTFKDASTGNVAVASVFCAFDAAEEETLHVATTQGVIEIDDFTHPEEGGKAKWRVVKSAQGSEGCHFTCVRTEKEEYTEEHTRQQKLDMWNDIAALLQPDPNAQAGAPRHLLASPEQARYWATIAWKTQAVMDKMLESARQNTRA